MRRRAYPALGVLSGEQYGLDDPNVVRSACCRSTKYEGLEEGIKFVD